MAQILVIDDQEDIVQLVVKALELQNHKVTGLTSVLDLDKNSLPRFDLILLDIMMPDVDGLQFCHEIRDQVDCPILFITAKTQEADIVQGLTYGADDYITKPYNPTILLLHIEAVFKRLHKAEPKLTYQNIRVNLMKSTLEKDDQELLLSKNEMGIFYYLLMNQGKIVTRDDIMNYLWGTDKFIDDNTLTVNMTRLRKRLEKIGLFDVIETRRDQGYMLI